jgi:MmyB-like transcription regulator ligand binding domain
MTQSLGGVEDREALERFLTAHEHHPAVVVDRHWNIAAWNRGVAHVTRGVAPELRTPPAKALRIALQSDGLAPRISNLADGERLAARAAPPRDRSDGRSRLEALYQELVA